MLSAYIHHFRFSILITQIMGNSNSFFYFSRIEYYETYLQGVTDKLVHTGLYNTYQRLVNDETDEEPVFLFVRGTRLPTEIDIIVPNSLMTLKSVGYIDSNVPIGAITWQVRTSLGMERINALCVQGFTHEYQPSMYSQDALRAAFATCISLSPSMTLNIGVFAKEIYKRCMSRFSVFNLAKVCNILRVIGGSCRIVYDDNSPRNKWIEILIDSDWHAIMHKEDKVYGPCEMSAIKRAAIDPISFAKYCELTTDKQLCTEDGYKNTVVRLRNEFITHISEAVNDVRSDQVIMKSMICGYEAGIERSITLDLKYPVYTTADGDKVSRYYAYFDVPEHVD